GMHEQRVFRLRPHRGRHQHQQTEQPAAAHFTPPGSGEDGALGCGDTGGEAGGVTPGEGIAGPPTGLATGDGPGIASTASSAFFFTRIATVRFVAVRYFFATFWISGASMVLITLECCSR